MHKRQPERVLDAIIVMLKRTTRVIWRIDVNALDLAHALLFKGFESEKVVAKDETVIEQVVIGYTVWRVIGLLRVFEQNTRLKPGPVLLPDPGEFEFLLVHVSSTARDAKKHRVFLGDMSARHAVLSGSGANRFKSSHPLIEMSALAANGSQTDTT